jgi:hypothetical protein
VYLRTFQNIDASSVPSNAPDSPSLACQVRYVIKEDCENKKSRFGQNKNAFFVVEHPTAETPARKFFSASVKLHIPAENGVCLNETRLELA